ncbi:MAG: ribbon-helix-helix domain-containing protein [Thermoplasmata archaeon]
MSGDMVTVSAKLPKGLRDRLDEIGEELGISNRSVLVRMALESFVERHEPDGIPSVESKTEGAERKRTGFEEMFGIPRGNAASRQGKEEDGDRRRDNGRH